MTEFFSSAAKIVFVMVAITACAAFLLGMLEGKDFMALAMMAFAFYFGTPNGSNSNLAGGVK